MDRHIDSELLSAYHDRALGPAQAGVVRAHLDGCGQCAARLRECVRADDVVRLAARGAGGDAAPTGWDDFRSSVLAAAIEQPFKSARRFAHPGRWGVVAAGIAAAAVLAVLLRSEPPIAHLDSSDPALLGGGATARLPTLPPEAASPSIARAGGSTQMLRLPTTDPFAPAPAATVVFPRAVGSEPAGWVVARAAPPASARPTSPTAAAVEPVAAPEVVSAPRPGIDPRAAEQEVHAALDAAERFLVRIAQMNPADLIEFDNVDRWMRSERLVERLTHLRRRADLESAVRFQAAALEAVFTKFTLAAGDYLSRDVEATQQSIRRRFEFRLAMIDQARRMLPAATAARRPTATAL